MRKNNDAIIAYCKNLCLSENKTKEICNKLYYLSEKDIALREKNLKDIFKDNYLKIMSNNPYIIGMVPETIDKKIDFLKTTFKQPKSKILSALISYPTALNISEKEIDKKLQNSKPENTFMENFKLISLDWKPLDKKIFPENFNESIYNELDSSIQGHASKPESLFTKYLLLRLFYSHDEIMSKKYAFTQSLESLYAKACFLIDNDIKVYSRLFIDNKKFEQRGKISKEELLEKYPITDEAIKKIEKVVYYNNIEKFDSGDAVGNENNISLITPTGKISTRNKK